MKKTKKNNNIIKAKEKENTHIIHKEYYDYIFEPECNKYIQMRHTSDQSRCICYILRHP